MRRDQSNQAKFAVAMKATRGLIVRFGVGQKLAATE
jgi:hypothetical protein